MSGRRVATSTDGRAPVLEIELDDPDVLDRRDRRQWVRAYRAGDVDTGRAHRVGSTGGLVLRSTPGLEGTVRTNFLIEAGGGVSRATAVGVHPVVDGCVAGVIGSLQFRPAIHGAEVNYPFTFRPVDDGEPEPPAAGE
jgi:hypothetical protein